MCLCVGHMYKPNLYKNGQTDRNAVWRRIVCAPVFDISLPGNGQYYWAVHGVICGFSCNWWNNYTMDQIS